MNLFGRTPAAVKIGSDLQKYMNFIQIFSPPEYAAATWWPSTHTVQVSSDSQLNERAHAGGFTKWSINTEYTYYFCIIIVFSIHFSQSTITNMVTMRNIWITCNKFHFKTVTRQCKII